MHKRTMILGGIVLVLILVFAYVQNNNSVQEKQKIKIGIISPMTGQVGFLGQNIVKSAELALQDLGYDNVEFIVEDAGNVGESAEAITAYRKLVDTDKVKIIIDGMSSDGTMAVSSLLEQDKVVMITPLTGGKNIDYASEFLFRNGPSDVYAGTAPAQYFKSNGLNNIVLLTDNAEYTLDIAESFKESFNGNIVLDEKISPDDKDFRTTLSKVSDYDAVFILTSTGQSSSYIIKQLCELGNTKPVFTNFLAFNPNAFDIAQDCIEGVYTYYPQSDSTEKAKDFLIQYKEKYGYELPISFHSTGTYDAVKMSVEAINSVGNDGQKIHEYLLEDIKDWDGINGKISFDARGNVEGGFRLMKITNKSLALVE